MLAVILAGGKGTRLKPFTMTLPKPLLPLGETPILEVVLRQLSAAGMTRIVLSVGPLSHLIRATIGDGSRFGARVEFIEESEPLGTAGCLRTIPDFENPTLIMNGDLLTTLDYRKLIAAHRTQNAAATIAVCRREVAVDYGVVTAGADGRLERYLEKPSIQYDVSMGINVLAASSLDQIPKSGRFDMPDLMLALQRAGRTVSTFRTDCYWQDIGRFDDYQRASEDFVRDPARFLPSK